MLKSMPICAMLSAVPGFSQERPHGMKPEDPRCAKAFSAALQTICFVALVTSWSRGSSKSNSTLLKILIKDCNGPKDVFSFVGQGAMVQQHRRPVPWLIFLQRSKKYLKSTALCQRQSLS